MEVENNQQTINTEEKPQEAEPNQPIKPCVQGNINSNEEQKQQNQKSLDNYYERKWYTFEKLLDDKDKQIKQLSVQKSNLVNEKEELIKESMRLREQLIMSERDKQIVEKTSEEKDQRLKRFEEMNKILLGNVGMENSNIEKQLTEVKLKLSLSMEKFNQAERKIMIQETMLKTAEKNEWMLKEQVQRMEQTLKNEEKRQVKVEEEKGMKLLRVQIDQLEKELEKKEEEDRRIKIDFERIMREQEFKQTESHVPENKIIEEEFQRERARLEEAQICWLVLKEKLESEVEILQQEKTELQKELKICQRKEEVNESMLKQKEMECRRLEQRMQKTGTGIDSMWSEKAEQYSEVVRKYDDERREKIKWKTMWEENEREREKRKGMFEVRANEYELIVNNCGMMKKKLEMSIKKNNASEKEVLKFEGMVKELREENGQVFVQIRNLSTQLACVIFINQMLKEKLFAATDGKINLYPFEEEYVLTYIDQLKAKKMLSEQDQDDLDFFSSIEKLLDKNCKLEAEMNKFRQKIKNKEVVSRDILDNTEQQLASVKERLTLKENEVNKMERKLQSLEQMETIQASILAQNNEKQKGVDMEEEQNQIAQENKRQQPLILKYESILRDNHYLQDQLKESQEARQKINNNQLWLNSEVSCLSKEVTQQRELMDQKQKRIDEKEGLLVELTVKNHELSEIKMRMELRLQELEIEHEKSEKRINFLQDNGDKMNKILDEVMKEKEQYFQGYLELQDKNAEIMSVHASVIKTMEKEMEEKWSKYEIEFKQYEMEKAQRMNCINVLTIKNENQGVQLQRYEQEVKMVEAIVNDKNCRIEDLEKELQKMRGEEQLISEFKLRSGFVRLEEESQENRQSVIELQEELNLHKETQEEMVGKYQRMLEEVSNKFLELETKYNDDLQKVKNEGDERLNGIVEEKEEIERKLEQALDEIKQWVVKEQEKELEVQQTQGVEEDKKEVRDERIEVVGEMLIEKEKYQREISSLKQQMEVLKDDKQEARNESQLWGTKNSILQQFEQEQYLLHNRQLSEYGDELMKLKEERNQLIELLMRKKKGWASFVRSGIGQKLVEEAGESWSDLEEYCEEEEVIEEEEEQREGEGQEFAQGKLTPEGQYYEEKQMEEEGKEEDDNMEQEEEEEEKEEEGQENEQQNQEQEQQEEQQQSEQQEQEEEQEQQEQQEQLEQQEEQEQQEQQEEQEEQGQQEQLEQQEQQDQQVEQEQQDQQVQQEEQEQVEEEQEEQQDDQIVEEQKQEDQNEEQKQEDQNEEQKQEDQNEEQKQEDQNEEQKQEDQNEEQKVEELEYQLQEVQEDLKDLQETEQMQQEIYVAQDQSQQIQGQQNIELEEEEKAQSISEVKEQLQNQQEQQRPKMVTKRMLTKDVLIMLKQKLKQLELELNSTKSNYFVQLSSEHLKQKELRFQIEQLENELLTRTQTQDIKTKWKQQVTENQHLIERVRQLEEQVIHWKARANELKMEKEKLYLRNIALEEIWKGMKEANEDLTLVPEQFGQMTKFLYSKQITDKLEKWKSMFLYFKSISSNKKVKK